MGPAILYESSKTTLANTTLKILQENHLKLTYSCYKAHNLHIKLAMILDQFYLVFSHLDAIKWQVIIYSYYTIMPKKLKIVSFAPM